LRLRRGFGMTSADIMRFVIIISLGVLGFITFLVAGTIIGLMWLDSWNCGQCKQYPVGLYILGLLGILFVISIGVEASEAPEPWQKWIENNWVTLVVVIASIITFFVVVNWWWVF
jgi:hypothetical protein